MTDKEVGELWRERWDELRKLYPHDTTGFALDIFMSLIRKLVEERAKHYQDKCSDGIPDALNDFGINSEEW